jgi:hypothetical protein
LAKNGYHVEANLADSNDVLFSYTLRSTSTGDTRKMKACWHSVYLALPMSARDIPVPSTQQPHKRQGSNLIHRGVKYFVECIEGALAILRVLNGKSEGRICPIPVDKLEDPEVEWLR